jgi:hypothetical protein
MAIVIRVDGVDITPDVVFSQTLFRCVADGQAGTATVVIADRTQTYSVGDFRMGMTLELVIDGTRYWDGWVFVVRNGWPMPVDDTTNPASVARTWTLEGYDRNLLFQKRILYRLSDPTDDSGLRIWASDTTDKVALEYTIDNYVDLSGDGLSYDIEEVGSPGPFEEFTLGYVGAPLGVAFDDAAKITGAVFVIGPGRVLRYHDDITPTAPFVLSDRPTASQVGYREFEIGSDFTGGATEAFVWGAGRGSDEAVFGTYSENPGNIVGRWQWGEIFVGASRQQTVNRRARTYIKGSPNHRRGHGDPVPVVRSSIFEPGLRTGDVVTFENALYDYQRDLPLRQMVITFPTPTQARFDLELTLRVDTPFGVPDPWDYHRKRIRVPPVPPIPEPIDPSIDTGTLIDHFDDPGGPYIAWTSTDFVSSVQTETLTQVTVDVPVAQPGDLMFVVFAYNASTLEFFDASFFSPVDEPGLTYPWIVQLQLGQTEQGEELGGWVGYRFIGPDETDTSISFTGMTTSDFGDFGGWVGIIRGAAMDPGFPGSIYEIYDPDPNPSPTSLGLSYMLAHQETGGLSIMTTPSGWDVEHSDISGDGGTLAGALGVATRRGGGIEPEWSTTPSTSHESWYWNYIEPIDAAVLRLPGPSVTGSPYTGGNPYFIDAGDAAVADSELYFVSSFGHASGGWSVRDYIRSVVSPTQGEITDPDPGSFPLTAFSTRHQLLLKWRYTQGLDTGWIIFLWDLLEEAPGEDYSNKMTMMFDVYWNWDGPATASMIDVGNDAYGRGPNEQWWSSQDFVLSPDTDYYILFDGGTTDRVRFKIWPVGDDEPSWMADLPVSVYQDTFTPDGNDWNEVSVEWGAVDYGTGIYLDAWWYLDATGAVASGGIGRFIAETPTQDLRNGETDLYLTSYPYMTGTLVVYLDGTRLREGMDFIEVAPAAGSFRVFDAQGAGTSLYVLYERAGTVPSPGSETTYRPAVQLMYGWGTEFDAWNALFACSAMALDRHTQGTYTATTGTPRSTPPEHRDQQSQAGYGNLLGIAEAWGNGWGETLHSPGIISWSNFVAKVDEGRGAIIQGMYGALPASKRFADIDRLHALYINERLSDGSFWGYDPIRPYGVIYAAGELQDFTEALGFVSPGDASAAFTQVTS